MRSQKGTILEIFNWKFLAAIEEAHHNIVVQQLWEECVNVRDFTTPGSLPEYQVLFAAFEPPNL